MSKISFELAVINMVAAFNSWSQIQEKGMQYTTNDNCNKVQGLGSLKTNKISYQE